MKLLTKQENSSNPHYKEKKTVIYTVSLYHNYDYMLLKNEIVV